MRHVLPAAAATALAVALAGCGSGEADPRGVERDEVLLQVVASGRAEATPDQARFAAGVETIAPSAAAASAGNAETINRVMAALRRLGVRDEDVQTRQISLHRIGHGADRGRFRAHNVVEVRIRDVGRAGQAIAAATEAGANVLSGPDLAVADPEAASRAAYANAYRAARQRADAYAEAAGLRVARVLAIRDWGEGGHGPPMPYYGAEMDAAQAQTAAPPAPPVQPGTDRREVRVRVDFALAE